jgi:hypothetical protein
VPGGDLDRRVRGVFASLLLEAACSRFDFGFNGYGKCDIYAGVPILSLDFVPNCVDCELMLEQLQHFIKRSLLQQ